MRTVGLPLFLILLFCNITKIFSQIEITGTVRDFDKKPLVGATIILEHSNESTSLQLEI